MTISSPESSHPDRSLGVAVLGTGRLGGRYVEIVKHTPGARMAVVAEPREEATASLREAHPDVDFAGDFRDVVGRDDVDIVVCTLPHHLHYDAALDAAASGKHIYMEKPLAAWLSQGEEMLEAARKAGVKLMTAHTQRYFPQVKLVKSVIGSGRVGEPVMANDFWHFPYRPQTRPAWMMDRRLGGGLAQMATTHQIDRLIYLFGNDMASASGVTGPLTHPEHTGADDSAMALLRWSSGRAATISTWGWRKGAVEYGAELLFTAGMARYSIAYGGGDSGDNGVWLADEAGAGWRKLNMEPADPMADEFSDFVGSVLRGDADTPIPQAHGLLVLKVLEAIEESSRSGREVQLD
jgi:predicted dehydrogenase